MQLRQKSRTGKKQQYLCMSKYAHHDSARAARIVQSGPFGYSCQLPLIGLAGWLMAGPLSINVLNISCCTVCVGPETRGPAQD